MITAAQLRKAARLVDRGWVQHAFRVGDRYCVNSAVITVSEGGAPYGLMDFDKNPVTHNDAPDCTKDAAVMFLLLCAEAREHGDL